MLTRGSLAVLAAVVAAAGCSTTVLETGPDATVGQGFQEVVVTLPATTAAPATTPGTATTAPANGGLDVQAGDCLTWEQGQTFVEFAVVACDAEHLVEVAGPGDLGDRFAAGTEFPDQASLQEAVAEVCSPVVVGYLGRSVAEGEEPGVIPPTEAAWAEGDRLVWCTVGLARQEGARVPYTGRLVDRGAG